MNPLDLDYPSIDHLIALDEPELALRCLRKAAFVKAKHYAKTARHDDMAKRFAALAEAADAGIKLMKERGCLAEPT